MPVENHDAAFLWQLRLSRAVLRPPRDAVVLEALAPGRRPERECPEICHVPGEVFLFVAELLRNALKITAVLLIYVGRTLRAEAINGRIPDCEERVIPVADDEEVTGMVEESVDPIDHNKVEVEEQCVFAKNRRNLWRERCQFAPAPFAVIARQGDGRYWMPLDLRAQAGPVVSQAYEPKELRRAPCNHAVQAIDVFGAVLGTPFHADDGLAVERVRAQLRPRQAIARGKRCRRPSQSLIIQRLGWQYRPLIHARAVGHPPIWPPGCLAPRHQPQLKQFG